MPRRVSPPVNELDSLPHPLTSGERRVFDFFNTRLAPEWEIYVQPHLNGLRPDFVLLHPRIGVAVFEVKDWSLNDAAYQVQRREDGTPVLMVNDHGEWRAIEQANPVEKILYYKTEHQAESPQRAPPFECCNPNLFPAGFCM